VSSQPDSFDDGLGAVAAGIAHRCEASPEVTDLRIMAFITAHRWSLESDPVSGRLVWCHPAESILERRVDVLAWCLTASRRRSGRWPAFCESCWRVP
jgi:hypothetical protein